MNTVLSNAGGNDALQKWYALWQVVPQPAFDPSPLIPGPVPRERISAAYNKFHDMYVSEAKETKNIYEAAQKAFDNLSKAEWADLADARRAGFGTYLVSLAELVYRYNNPGDALPREWYLGGRQPRGTVQEAPTYAAVAPTIYGMDKIFEEWASRYRQQGYDEKTCTLLAYMHLQGGQSAPLWNIVKNHQNPLSLPFVQKIRQALAETPGIRLPPDWPKSDAVAANPNRWRGPANIVPSP